MTRVATICKNLKISLDNQSVLPENVGVTKNQIPAGRGAGDGEQAARSHTKHSMKARKLTYPVGATVTVGKPTVSRIGFGRFVTMVGATEDGKLAIVANPENPEQTAQVKFANLGNIIRDGREFDMVSQKFTPLKKLAKSAIPQAVSEAFTALRSYEQEVGDQVSGGKARRLGRLRDAFTSALAEAGLTEEQVAPALG